MQTIISFKDYLTEEISITEKTGDSESLLEAVSLDTEFITTPRITLDSVLKLIKSPTKLLVTTDGKWTVSTDAAKSSSNIIAFITFGKADGFTSGKDVQYTSVRVGKNAAEEMQSYFAGASSFEELMSTKKFTDGFQFDRSGFNPYSAKKMPAYSKARPTTGYNRLKPADVVGMVVNGQIKSAVNRSGTMTPLKGLISMLSTGLGSWSKVIVSDDAVICGGVEFTMDTEKFASPKSVKVDKTAPAGLKVDGKTPVAGGWLSGSVHYTMLAGADAYQIVGFSGKASIIVQEYAMKDVSKDGHTRVLVVDPSMTKVGKETLIRVNKGTAKVGSMYLRYSDKVDDVRFSGSAYD